MIAEKRGRCARRCAVYAFSGVLLCTVAWLVGGWFGHLRTRPPAGFEATAIPGVFVDRRIVDLGMIIPDRGVQETFRLVNRGSSTYVVKKATTDCGCASVDLTDEALPPGGSLSIPLKINTSGLPGDSFKKGVLVDLSRVGYQDSYKDAFHIEGKLDRSGTCMAWPGIIDCGQ